MIYFLYGEDTFRAREALKNIESNFVKEYGDLNIDKLDGADLKKGLLESKVQAMPFLSEKRLVIVNNLLLDGVKEAKTKAEEALKIVPESTDLVFFEEGLPDKRESIYKKLSKLPGCQLFDPLNPLELRKWIESRVSSAGLTISNEASTKLFFYVGSDLHRLHNEIARIGDFVKAQKRSQIEPKDIEKLVEPNNSFKIFDLTDALAQKNSRKALNVLYSFKKAGEDEFRIFNLIIHQLRTMLIIEDLMTARSSDQIAKETGLHPFVVKKNLPSIKRFPANFLKKMYEKAEDADFKIKSGQIDIGCALDLLIVDFCER